jgi:T4 beta protein
VIAYMPILKGRDAEFTALGHLSQTVVPHILPVFEVAPATDGPEKATSKFGARVLDWLPKDLTIAVDVRYLPSPANSRRGPMRGIAEELQVQQVRMLPVVRLVDSEHRLADVGYAADLHGGQAVLRLGGDTQDPDDGEAEEQPHRLHDCAGLPIDQCHLLLDVFDVRSERDVSRVEP